MKIIFKYLISIIFVSILVFNMAGNVSLATDATILLKEAGTTASYQVDNIENKNHATLIGDILNIFLSFLGIIFIGLAIYGGFLWMNARGDSEQVNKARNLIVNAVIGVVVIVGAYAVTYFIFFMIARDYSSSSGF